jgi:hypothetical protein
VATEGRLRAAARGTGTPNKQAQPQQALPLQACTPLFYFVFYFLKIFCMHATVLFYFLFLIFFLHARHCRRQQSAQKGMQNACCQDMAGHNRCTSLDPLANVNAGQYGKLLWVSTSASLGAARCMQRSSACGQQASKAHRCSGLGRVYAVAQQLPDGLHAEAQTLFGLLHCFRCRSIISLAPAQHMPRRPDCGLQEWCCPL